MIRLFTTLGAVIILLTTSCSTSKPITSIPVVHQMPKDVGTLASDFMEGRKTGTEGELKAAAYISRRMDAIGLAPKGDGMSYQQVFQKKMTSNPHAEPSANDPVLEGVNVVGYLNNQAPYTVVIGAHYDHLGMGGPGSLHDGPPAIHNGADDNASGVAVMLRLAEYLKLEKKAHGYNYLFIAFSGEEQGLLGSNYYTKHPTIDLSKVSYMINMDMVGRLKEDRSLAIYGTGTSPVWKSILWKIKKPAFKFIEDERGIGPSDHTSFYLSGIPVLAFFTGQHEHYHKQSDDIEQIHYSGMEDIGTFIYNVIVSTDTNEKLTFTETASNTAATPDFKVTLGVMPDYLYDGKGLRIDGVREGRPAHGADIQKGDIVIKMGDMDITDMQAYMQALASFNPGETVMVTVLRDGQEVKKKVVF